MDELEQRVQVLEKKMKQAINDINYLRESNRTLAENNKDYLRQIKEFKNPTTMKKRIMSKNREVKNYINTIKKAGQLEIDRRDTED